MTAQASGRIEQASRRADRGAAGIENLAFAARRSAVNRERFEEPNVQIHRDRGFVVRRDRQRRTADGGVEDRGGDPPVQDAQAVEHEFLRPEAENDAAVADLCELEAQRAHERRIREIAALHPLEVVAPVSLRAAAIVSAWSRQANVWV